MAKPNIKPAAPKTPKSKSPVPPKVRKKAAKRKSSYAKIGKHL